MNNGESKNIIGWGEAKTANPMRSDPKSFHRGFGQIESKEKCQKLNISYQFAEYQDAQKILSPLVCAGCTMQDQNAMGIQ